MAYKQKPFSGYQDKKTKQKIYIAENYEKHKDKEGFKEHVDDVFGGSTKFKGKITTTHKRK